MERDIIAIAEAHVRSARLDDDFAAVAAAAVERFAALSWPTQAEEEWRRTALSGVELENFATLAEGCTEVKGALGEGTAGAGDGGGGDGAGDGGIAVYRGVEGLAGLPDERRALLVEKMRKRVEGADNRFILWPYLFFADVVVIDARGEQSDVPVALTTTLRGGARFAAPIVGILSDRDARVCVLHTIVSADDECHLCVHDSLAVMGECARAQFVCIYDLNINSYHFSNGQATLGKDSMLEHGTVALGGLLSKTRYDAHLVGAGAEAYLNGVYVGYEDQHHDLRTLQVHDAPSTNSFALYRGVVLDEAHTIYQGLIQVTGRATGTDAYLTNNNLLMSDEARADSIPSLNISTDEVKCSHGSTTGKVDALQLFYLQSRGLSREEAQAMIVEGFTDEALARFPAESRERARAAVRERIGGA